MFLLSDRLKNKKLLFLPFVGRTWPTRLSETRWAFLDMIQTATGSYMSVNEVRHNSDFCSMPISLQADVPHLCVGGCPRWHGYE